MDITFKHRPKRSGEMSHLKRQEKRAGLHTSEKIEAIARLEAHRAGGLFINHAQLVQMLYDKVAPVVRAKHEQDVSTTASSSSEMSHLRGQLEPVI